MYPEWLPLLGGQDLSPRPRVAVTQLSVFNYRLESDICA